MQLHRRITSKAIKSTSRPATLCVSYKGIHTITSNPPKTQPVKPTHRDQHKMSLWYPGFGSPHHPHTTSSLPGFSSLFRMLDDFDKYARDLGTTHTTSSTSLQNFNPKFDVTEHENDYTLQGELPGVPSSNVSIEFTDPQTMVISGHVEKKHEEGDPSLKLTGADTKKIEGKKGEETPSKSSKTETSSSSEESPKPKYWLSERSFGEFSRVFSFPKSVDQDKVEAKFDNGILDIKVPKAEKKGTKKITIQ